MRPRCPTCGSLLTAVAVVGGSPPWGCTTVCQRGWWDAELDARGRASWDAIVRAHRNPRVLEAAQVEHLLAEVRGTSVTPESLPHVADASLEQLARARRISSAMRTTISAERARRAKAKPK